MKILVTGATGFIGRYVMTELLRRCDANDKIIATFRDVTKAQTFSWYEHEQVESIPCDLHEARDDFSLFHHPDTMIHLAWTGLPNYQAAFHREENLPADCRFLDNMIRDGLQRLLVTGTCFEYGLHQGAASEDTPPAPCTEYARAKDALRKHLFDLRTQYPHLSICWARLFYMFGEGQNPRSFASLLRQAIHDKTPVFNMSGGEQLIDYSPVTQIAEKIVRLALEPKADGIYNVCSGQPMTLHAFAEDIIAKEHATITLNRGYYPYSDYESMALWGDTTKWNALFGEPS